MDWIKFFEGNLYSNIINTLSAIGTIGAVIVSLYLSRSGERIKYKIKRQVIVPVGYCGNFTLRYDLELINLTRNNQIVISSYPYIRNGKTNIIIKNYIPFYEKLDDYNFPRKLNYGDKLLISIDKTIAKDILKNSSKKRFKLIVEDVLGNKFKYTIKRSEMEVLIKNSEN